MACVGMAASLAHAGAKLEINENTTLDLGMRIQTLFISSEKDLNGDGDYQTDNDFRVRRARLRLKANITEWVEGFIQSEASEDLSTGSDARIIDAFITVKPTSWTQLVMGEHMAPASRQNLTSSGALMAMDRPGMAYKPITWGTRSVARFATSTYSDSDAGLRGDVDVRDSGATLFGTGSFSDTVHAKYYLGAYDGVQAGGSNDERVTGRVQVNFFDPEGSYFNNSTYLGAKKTIGFGSSYDIQNDVGDSPSGVFDYAFYTFDLFGEWPVGPGAVTFETAYQNLDLDDAAPLVMDDGSLSPNNPKESQGDGMYVQAGYYVNQWQPWAEYESWDSDGADDKGDYDIFRVGVSYYFEGHNANVKVGYERFHADANIGSSSEDTINTFALGLYLTY
jgi:hypothetical protein